jgi:hypothetical protein
VLMDSDPGIIFGMDALHQLPESACVHARFPDVEQWKPFSKKQVEERRFSFKIVWRCNNDQFHMVVKSGSILQVNFASFFGKLLGFLLHSSGECRIFIHSLFSGIFPYILRDFH